MQNKKPTPSQRIKALKQGGWLDFAEYMVSKNARVKDLRHSLDIIKEYVNSKTSLFLASDIEEDFYSNTVDFNKPSKMLGLSEQLKPKKSNKLTKRGFYGK